VLTGLGAITPVGCSPREFWQSLDERRSGVASVRAFRADDVRPSYAAEVKDFRPESDGLPRKKAKVMGRHAQFAYAAARQAYEDAGLVDCPALDRKRLGVVLGIGMLNADVIELGRAFHAMACAPETNGVEENGGSFDHVKFGRVCPSQLFPLWLLRHIPNLAAAHVSIGVDAQGPSNTITTGCVSAANAIGEAARIIARGDADVLLAGGADARVSPLGMLRYRELGWLATRDDIEPTAVSAPFDASASGFVNGEGAGVVVLEALDHARDRGARVYAELVGYGAANDGCEVFRPDPAGRALTRATRACLETCGLTQDDADVMFAPATSVPSFDRAVASGLEAAFSRTGKRPVVTATRSLVGHTHAASVALDCVAAVKSIEHARIPATINVEHPVTNLPLARGESCCMDISAAVVTAYGFGGHAAAIALRRFFE